MLKFLDMKEIERAKIDKEQAIGKQLIDDESYKLYREVQALYKKVFDNYLESLIPIKEKVDKKLEESKLDYGKLPKEQENAYKKFSYLNSDYFFVRNFFYIERLEEDDLKEFVNKIKEKDFEINDNLTEIVKRTFKDIIKVISRRGHEKFKVFYGPVVPLFEFYNDSLVLFINYGRNTIKLEGEEFINNKRKKEAYLKKLTEELKKEFEEKLDTKVEMMYYKWRI